jgi:hypothetical protein
MARQLLRIAFSDFWPDFKENDNFFVNMLRPAYKVVLSQTPDLLIYSCFGNKHEAYKCPRIFYSGERISPDFSKCNYAFSFDYIDDERHFRLPIYAFWGAHRLGFPKPSPEAILAQKKSFCCFVVSEPKCTFRNRFFAELSRYKKVDSAGRFLNNIGGPLPMSINGVDAKMQFIKDYKFVMSFENQSYPGYTTEKIVQSMLMHSMPIYWGNPIIDQEFNTRSFINCHDYADMYTAIRAIIALDQDDSAYCNMLREPWFNGGATPEWMQPSALRSRICHAVEAVTGVPQLRNDIQLPVALNGL